MIEIMLAGGVTVTMDEKGEVKCEVPENMEVSLEDLLRLLVKKIHFYERKVSLAHEVLSKEI